MSVKDLAESLQIKPAGVYNYIYGKSKPSYEAVEKLILLGAKANEVFSDDVAEALAENDRGPGEALPISEEALDASVLRCLSRMIRSRQG